MEGAALVARMPEVHNKIKAENVLMTFTTLIYRIKESSQMHSGLSWTELALMLVYLRSFDFVIVPVFRFMIV